MDTSSQPKPHRARKRFGQHFLKDTDVVERIVSVLDPGTTGDVVEIGPGEGALTASLIERFTRLDVVELDRDLAATLPQRLGHPAGLHVHSTDALSFDFCQLCKPQRTLTVVGNLPYNISTPLLFRLLEQRRCIGEMVFMLQLEVVERIIAAPGGADYGRLSIMMQLHCEPELLFEVPPSAFTPPPKVDSAVLRLAVRAEPAVDLVDVRTFDQLVRDAFSMRRKTLRNSLRQRVSPAQFDAAGIDPRRRAETLHLVEFARLSNEVSS